MIDQKQWVQIKTVVAGALALESSRRKEYITQACGGDEHLLVKVRERLHSITESEKEGFLGGLASNQQTFVRDLSRGWSLSASPTALIGQNIGPYKITEELGSGGMGAVYQAERVDGAFHQTVAIKLIKRDVESEETIRRFKQEREILASLSHPNIAQLYDGGITPDGVPYLIMEYVEGEPIDGWCDKKQYTIKERLELFQKACEVIQFAHQNMIVHRDLKPQNIFVSTDGQVKVLDFGIAKMLEPIHPNQKVVETRLGSQLWTPQFAAPEQVMGKNIGIATDVYALGALLYTLLGGVHPYDFSDKSTYEIESFILKDDPPAASKRVAKTDQEIWKNRGLDEGKQYQKILQGDLDAIMLKAMRRQPKFRYQSVNELLDDLQRYESNLPLHAREGTLRYRSSKFWKRHKFGVIAGSIFLITLFFYFYQLKQERDYAQLEAKKAQEVTKLITSLFNSSDPNYAGGKTITTRDLLDKGALQVQEMDSQPAIQANMLVVVGQMYQNLGLYNKSKPLFERAFDINRNLYGIRDSRTIESFYKLLGIYYLLQETNQAQKYFSLIRENNLLRAAEPNIQSVFLLTTRGLLAIRQGKYDSAEVWHQRAFNLYNLVDSPEKNPVYTSLLLNNIGFSLENEGNYNKALGYYKDSRKEVVSILGENHTLSAVAFGNLGRIYREMNMLDSATYYNNKALNIRLDILGEQHEQVADSHFNAALIARKKGNIAVAKEHFRKAEQIYRQTVSDSSLSIGLLHMERGELYLVESDSSRAKAFLKKSLNIFKTSLRPDHPWIKRNLLLQDQLDVLIAKKR